MAFRDRDPDVDAIALRDGWISVTPLGLSLQNNDVWEVVKKWKL